MLCYIGKNKKKTVKPLFRNVCKINFKLSIHDAYNEKRQLSKWFIKGEKHNLEIEQANSIKKP